MEDKERSRNLGTTLSQIEKQFGKGSILRLGSKEAIVPVTVISSGSISLDCALWAWAASRAAASMRSSGRSRRAKPPWRCRWSRRRRRRGGMAAFIDVEHALDPAYASKLGVDVDNLLVSQPDYGEQALEITNALIASGAIDVLVVDSVAALVPKAELEGEMGDSHMGVQARLMSQAHAQAHRRGLALEHLSDFHQSDSREDRRHVRQSGNHHRRPGAEILFVHSSRHPPHRRDQGRRQR